MTRGPQKTPTADLNARGAWRGKARQKGGEPQFEIVAPPAPEFLEDDALELYNDLAPLLARRGVMTSVDRMALGMLCDALRHFLIARGVTDKVGLLIKDRDGTVRKNPADVQARDYHKLYLQWAREFGITPASRAGIRVDTDIKNPPKGGDSARSRAINLLG